MYARENSGMDVSGDKNHGGQIQHAFLKWT